MVKTPTKFPVAKINAFACGTRGGLLRKKVSGNKAWYNVSRNRWTDIPGVLSQPYCKKKQRGKQGEKKLAKKLAKKPAAKRLKKVHAKKPEDVFYDSEPEPEEKMDQLPVGMSADSDIDSDFDVDDDIEEKLPQFKRLRKKKRVVPPKPKPKPKPKSKKPYQDKLLRKFEKYKPNKFKAYFKNAFLNDYPNREILAKELLDEIMKMAIEQRNAQGSDKKEKALEKKQLNWLHAFDGWDMDQAVVDQFFDVIPRLPKFSVGRFEDDEAEDDDVKEPHADIRKAKNSHAAKKQKIDRQSKDRAKRSKKRTEDYWYN